ncbi:MAG: hypothetical protein PHT75_02005 [Bacilli bacterium]|nr:hypothetical protein [Bacilli bacterium]MDD3304884.1 hypothetical protein [Bacilli bacterium]MDD4053516.1 hypothetical protein [Bacilli bacterium]MDD4411551.1 hypothetical protein [Bacilli bacterium]
MLKKSFQFLGLTILIGFSFFYTNEVINMVRDKDPLMIKIQEFETIFNKDSVDAFIEDDFILPGINACVVDTNSSYSNMKKIGSYNNSLIEYREIKPDISLDNIYDKYIVKGNKSKLEVALVFKLNDSRYTIDLINILSKKSTKASFFVDGKLIENDSQSIYNLINQGHEIYNLGYDGEYDKNLLVWTNNMIENMSYNKPKYCLLLEENKKVLDICSSNKMYTIKAELLINYRSTFNNIMSNIDKGSLIIFDVNEKTTTELTKTLLFLNSKGFTYNVLSEHLSEKGCSNTD